MKKTFLLLAVIILAFASTTTKAVSIEVSGIVSGIWDVDTVRVVGNIQIREAESLLIMPGVMVVFEGSWFFEVKGALIAGGSQSSPIRFTMADTTGFHNDTLSDGGWKNIRIENINPIVDSTLFKYCHFEYGKAVSNDSIHGYGGAIGIRNSDKVSIENCVFANNYAYYNGGAIYLENASIKICNNHFENNSCGQIFVYYGYGGGICSDWGEPLIKHNTFFGNTSTGIGGGLCVRFSDCLVSHNVFDSNYSALGGGFGILHIVTCNFVISNNLFTQNDALFFGAAISNGDCSPTYINNTITDNHCSGGGGGFYCKDSVVPVLYNNIIYGNTQFGGEINQVYLWDLLSQPDFYFNNIEGGKESFYGTGGSAYYGEYENNIDENPLFEPGLFAIQNGSPCVNTGNPDTNGLMIPEIDLAGNTRIVDNRIDMGAYENQEPVNVNVISFEIPVFDAPIPNPASSSIKLSFELLHPGKAKIWIQNMSGHLILQIFQGRLGSGKHSFDWNIDDSDAVGGTYFALFELEGKTYQQKIVVAK